MKKNVYWLLALSMSLFSFTCEKGNDQEIDPDKFEAEELILQPGPGEGQDCLVAYRQTDGGFYAAENHILNPDITAISWTYDEVDAGKGVNRTYLKFTELSEVPRTADILYARLSLYGVTAGVAAPLGNSFYPGSPYEPYGSNAAWLKMVLSDWADTTITWNNKPETSDEYQAAIPASTAQWNFDVTDIDVTNMVRKMIKSEQNYGFCLQLQSEQIYRSILFGSSEAEDPAKRPKLVVQYVVTH